ncbi:RHS repeat domain-containing protein [Pseudomonas cannabina]|nr:RHS repeat-associated core domain-containing protein [Pseudomonas cannabina]SDR44384.1 RHS repeat-associated core domain-containing protein [Pseudomonas cannabina]
MRQNPDHITATWHSFNKNHLQTREELQVQFQAEKITKWEFTDASPGEKGFGLPTKITTDYADLSHPKTEKTTTVQTLTYNNIGQLTKSIAVDGVVTEWLYYPDTGGQGLDLSLIAEKPLSKDLATLTCPKVPEGYLPPVKLEYVHDPAYPKSQQITAYAYQTRENPVTQRSLLVPSTVVVLTGVRFDATTMYPSLMRRNALIEQRVISRSGPDVAIDNTTTWKESVVQNTWLGTQQNTLTTSMLYDDNPSVGRTVRAEAQGQIISSRTFSRLSGRPLSETIDGLEFRYVSDSLGRLVRQERGATEANAWKAEAVETTDYSITAEGLQVTVTEAEQQVRTLYDGLQRPVRVAVKQTILPDSAFCVISRIEYDGLDATNQTLYDYLPGGLRRTKDARPEAAMDASKMAWMADCTREDAGILINEQIIGSDSGAQLIRQLSGRSLDKGNTALLETLRPSTAKDASTDRTIERTFDDERRLIKIRTNNTSEHRIEYDELERAVAIIAPDGTRTERKYHKLSDYITQLNVGSTVLGTQKTTATARQTTVGELTYEFPGGSASTVVRPDKTLLESAVSADGRTATLSINRKVHTQRVISQPNVLTVTVNPVSVTSAEAWSSLTSSPQSLGLTSITQTSPRGSRQAEMTRSLKGRLLTSTAVDGRQMRVFRDYLDRVVRVIHGELHYHYLWSAFGEPLQRTVVNQASGERLDVRFTWDAFGQEIAREYTLNNKPLLALTNSYLANGQVSSKTLTREGVLQRTEGFSYDARDRLKSYECKTDVAGWPQDQAGKSLSKQSYGYDELYNLSECSSTYADGSTCIQTYTYDTIKNPTRRLSVTTELRSSAKAKTTSTQTATLAYDANGNQTTDESGRTLAYTPLGQLASVKDNDGKLLTRYSYDAFGRLISQYVGATKHTCELLYDGTQLTGEAWFDDANKEFKRILFSEDMVQQTCIGETVRSDFVLTDPSSGVAGFSAHDGTGAVKLSPLGYTPYGESSNLDSGCRLGFNSERIDPVLGCYHLGNGYRTYSPAQRHWLQPDTWSPLGAGGINNTAYCAGDPVNLFDPSGHVMISRWGASNIIRDLVKVLQEERHQPVGHFWRGLAVNASVAVAGVLMTPFTGGSSLAITAGVLVTTLAIASAGLDIASYVLEDVNPELARKLGIASTALGFISNAPFRTGLRLGGRLLRWTSSRAGRLISRLEPLFRKGPQLRRR